MNNKQKVYFSEYQKQLFYILKTFALFCIVMLHSHYKNIEYSLMPLFIERFARSGVFLFFLLGGYFYHPTNFVAFWKKKINTFFIPWIVAGCLTYILYHFRGIIYFSPIEILNWILGNGSWLYFMTMICCCYLICFKFYNSSKIIFITIILTIISVLLTAFGYLENINPYLNIFNWLGIFTFGIYLQRFNIENIINYFKKYFVIIILLCIIVFIFTTIFDKSCSYWSYYSLISEFAVSIILFYLSLFISTKKFLSIYLSSLGTKTLFIYLYHVMFINHILVSQSLDKFLSVALLRPLIVIILLDILYRFGNKILIGKLNKFYNSCLGIRI